MYEQTKGSWRGLGPTFFSKLKGWFKLYMKYRLFLHGKTQMVLEKTALMYVFFECHPTALPNVVSVAVVALEQLLTELEDFLRILDKESLSSTAVLKKSFLSDLLRVYTKSTGTGREHRGTGLMGIAAGS